MKKIAAFYFFFLPLLLSAQSASRFVYLVGDAGEDTTAGPALLRLKEELNSHSKSTVLFLGDNVYPNGLKKGDRISEKHLLSQLQLLNDFPGQAYIVPGNHDWDGQKRTGLDRLKDEQDFVEAYMQTATTVANRSAGSFFPKNGLPGPASVMADPKLRLVLIDTQWFLQFYKKNVNGSKKKTISEFYARLDSLLSFSKAHGETVIVAAHHPMYTNGQHSKSRQPWRFLINRTPFQLFGLLGLDRLYSQDIDQPRYKKMRKKMLGIFSKYDNVIYVSGHDHNLQCFREGSTRYIVSGAGSKLSHLQKKKRFDSVFQDDSRTGFIRLELKEDGAVETTIFQSGAPEKKLEGF
ncbi:MAG: metallophosphoesterase [Bacteroidia bacterium]